MHPAYDGLAALPYYDEFDLSTVDVLLISQYVLPLTLSDGVFFDMIHDVLCMGESATRRR